MATDVETSSKRNIMDFFRPGLKNSTVDHVRKVKKMQDFFSMTKKNSTSESPSSDDVIIEETIHHVNEMCTNDVEPDRDKEAAHEKKLRHLECALVNKDIGKTENSTALEVKDFEVEMFTVAECTQLRPSKKRKKRVVKDNSDKEQIFKTDDQDNDIKNMPHEIEYEEFIKTFSHSQHKKSTNFCDTKREQSIEQSCIDRAVNNMSEKKAAAVDFAGKQHAEASVLRVPSKSSNGQCNNNNKECNNTKADAFFLLMQARRKRQEESANESGYLKDDFEDFRDMSNAENENMHIHQTQEMLLKKSSNSSTPSVLNYFTKCSKSKKNIHRHDGGRPIIVQVDIHCDPGPKRKLLNIKSNTKLERKVEKLEAVECDNDIVFLSSETIEVEDCSYSNFVSKIIDKGSNSVCTDLSKERSNCCKKSKNHMLQQKQDEYASKKKQALSCLPPDISESKAHGTFDNIKADSLNMSSGFSNLKPEKLLKKYDDSVSVFKSAKRTNTYTKKEIGAEIRNKRLRISSGDSGVVESDSNIESRPKTLPQLRKSVEIQPVETGHCTLKLKHVQTAVVSKSRAHELLHKAQQHQCQKDSKNSKCHSVKSSTTVSDAKENMDIRLVMESSTCNTASGIRRQSQRLAEQQKNKQCIGQQNAISVGSDLYVVETATSEREKTRATKLAPIFAKKNARLKDIEPKQLAEDPEIVQKRWEFLMSGVPMELKRQESSTTLSVTSSQVFHFPAISHVQQLTQAESEHADVGSLPFQWKQKTVPEEENNIAKTALEWTCLQWPHTAVEKKSSSQFQKFSGSGFSADVLQMLLKKLQPTNPHFPFTVVFDRCRKHLSGNTTEKCSSLILDDTATTEKTSKGPEVIIIDEVEDAISTSDRDSQWPEALQPKSASEIIGNESGVRRLQLWLEEWKDLMQFEARLMARSGTGGIESDFDLSEIDSDEEGRRLCNTVILEGPHGVGKTAAVYALANQLSYKVFEVNAASSRQGRHILAQLQEATQSHQVAQKKRGDNVGNPLTPTSRDIQQIDFMKKERTRKKSAIPTAFSDFFKNAMPPEVDKSSGSCSSKKDLKKNKNFSKKDVARISGDSEQDTSRKRKSTEDVVGKRDALKKQCREKDKSAMLPNLVLKEDEESDQAGCVNLTSTSLILFDEVDLVFEEDSGFLQAVQYFMKATKIPIIMTTADPSFKQYINARFETISFKALSALTMTSYLEMTSLASGTLVHPDNIRALVASSKGDMRHALLTLQFLALSGGSKEPYPVVFTSEETITYSDKEKLQSEVPLALKPDSCVAEHKEDSDEDFISLKPLRRTVCPIVDDNDSSNSEITVSQTARNKLTIESNKENPSAGELSMAHLYLDENLSASWDLFNLSCKCIKDDYSSAVVQQLMTECLNLKTCFIDIQHLSLLKLFPLPKTTLPRKWCSPNAASKTRKRKRILSKIFDSESSDDEKVQRKTPQWSAADSASTDSNNKPKVNCSESNTENTDCKGEQAFGSLSDDFDREQPEAKLDPAIRGLETQDKDSEKAVTVLEEQCSFKVTVAGSASGVPVTKTTSTDVIAQYDTVNLERKKRSSVSELIQNSDLGSKLLSNFAQYSESLSFLDSTFGNQMQPVTDWIRNRASLKPGVEDAELKDEPKKEDVSLREDLKIELAVRTGRCVWQSVGHHVSAWRQANCSDKLPDGCSIPVKCNDSFFSQAEAKSNLETYKAVADSLPLSAQSSLNPITLDYLPTLRAISQAEYCRELAKTKRRFHHHFDSIGLCLDDSSIKILRAEFPAIQQN